MKMFKIDAARITDCTFKTFEIEANTKAQAKKKFEKLFGHFWMIFSIK